MPEDNNAVGFKTALFGFKKADVLACIDKMAADAQEKAQQADARAQELQASIDSLKQDNGILLEKTRDICSQLTAQDKRAAEAEKEAAALREKLERSEEEASLYKKRLFAKEQEALLLKGENATLNDRLRENKQAVEQAQAAQQQAQRQMEMKVAAAEESARADVLAVEENAERRILQARQEARQEAAQIKAGMATGAQEIADSVSVLKGQLADVDAKIAAAAEQLQRTTAALHAALDGTEENLLLLGVQMQQFPQPAPGAKPPQPQGDGQPAHKGAASGADAGQANGQRKPLSTLLLDKIARMLSE